MMTIGTAPAAGLDTESIPLENTLVETVEKRLIGTLNGVTGEFKPAAAAPALVPTSENPVALEKKSRSYTRRAEIAGKCVLVTLHPDRIELRAKYGRQRAEWAFEKLWDAAEGKLL
jgi:hypothetical protein